MQIGIPISLTAIYKAVSNPPPAAPTVAFNLASNSQYVALIIDEL